jgi:hypothetical protein
MLVSDAPHVVDDHVLGADLDLGMASGAAIELGGDSADQPCLVTLGVEGAEAVAGVGKLGHVEATP